MSNFEKLEEQRETVKRYYQNDEGFSWSGSKMNFQPSVGDVGVAFKVQDDGMVQPYLMREKNGVFIAEQRLQLIEIDQIAKTFFTVIRESGSTN